MIAHAQRLAQQQASLHQLQARSEEATNRAADVDRAKAALAENKIQAASVDWDSVDVGAREDALPLHKPGRMPWLIRAGFLVAVLAIVLMLACFAYVFWPERSVRKRATGFEPATFSLEG